MPEDRRLAAIMFTDIVGYTALMGKDEDKAFQLLRKNRNIQRPLIKKYRGKWLKEMGDGILASFHTASDAVRCAGKIQQVAKNEGIALRIGIHSGEVVFEGHDVLGDGVNVASRLEELAEEGAINISGAVYKDIKNKTGIKAEFVEEKVLKNVDEPVKIYNVIYEEGYNIPTPNTQSKNKNKNRKLLYLIPVGILFVIIAALLIWYNLPEQPIQELEKSIAVLPIKSLSDDPDKQYLADGVMDAITSHLAKIRELRVTARTSLEQYRDQSKDVREIGREINVNYLVEGSFQMFGNDARLIIQLINTNDGSHVWSNEYDREWEDIFAVQSEVAQVIAKEIEVIISPKEKQDIETIPTTDLTAYDYYLRGEEYLNRSFDEQDYRYAINLFTQAIEIDPDFTLAWVGLAAASRFIFVFYYDRSQEQLFLTKDYLEKAKKLSPNQKEVQLEEAKYHYICRYDYPKALQIFERLESNYPNDAEILLWIGFVYRRMGEFEKAMEYHDRVIILNPSDWLNWHTIGLTHEVLREYNEAEKYFKKVIELNPSIIAPYHALVQLYTVTGNIIEAKELLEKDFEFSDDPDLKGWRSEIAVFDGNYEEAISIIESLSEDSVSQQGHSYYSKHIRLGLIYYMMKNQEMANKHFKVVKTFLEEKIDNTNYDHRLYCALGIAYAGLDMKQKAIEAGEKALDILNYSKDAFDGLGPEMDMIKILVITNEYEEAFRRLEDLLNRTGFLSVENLKLDPFWNPVREMDKFKEIISNPKYQIDLSEN